MIIHLGDETRAEVISSVLGQLSDGIWESSNAMHKYWMFADVENTDLIIDDEPENGGTDYRDNLVYNGFYGKNEKQIKDWFANKAKQVVKIWAEDEGKNPKLIWNRANDDDVVDYMGHHRVPTITVADVYECYDFLKGRSGKKYGIAADPLPYEVECSTRRTFTKYPSNYIEASDTLIVDDSTLEYGELQFRENSFTEGQSVRSIKEVTDSLYEITVTVDHSGDYYTLHVGISTDDLMEAYNNPFDYILFSPEYVTVIDARSISQIPYDRDSLMNQYDSSRYDYQIRFMM